MNTWQHKMGEGVGPYLEPGESVLAAMSAAIKGKSQIAGGAGLVGDVIGGRQARKSRAAADAAGVTLPVGTIGVVVTQRRMLIVSVGVGAKVKELVSAVPVDAVESIEVKRIGLGGTITLNVHNQPIKLEGRVGPGRELAVALQAAKSSSRS